MRLPQSAVLGREGQAGHWKTFQPFMLAEPHRVGVWGYCREGRLLRMAACQSR